MSVTTVRNERGIALVIAMVALVVIGAIVAGTTYISLIEQRTSTNTTVSSQAFQAAEAGVQEAIVNWDIGWNTMAVGGQTALTRVNTYGGSYSDRTLSKLNDNLFLVVSRGTQGNATQSLAAVLRLVIADLDVQAAVTAGGDVRIGGNSTVQGEDTSPLNWGCTPGATRTGIRSSGDVQPSGGSYTLSGAPPINEFDATVNDNLFQDPFNELRERATLTLHAGAYNGMSPVTSGTPARCNTASSTNWGEPWRAPAGGRVPECQTYAPIILATGSIHVQNGRGQGILLVDGDLEIRGNFEFTGLVIVLGEVRTNGTGSKITGGLLANQISLADESSFLGNPTVAFSECALAYVLNATALARPVRGRSFAYSYN
ncbi:MAG TPA: PilX N-terminal domain-containing pilus assembly protein [Gemmatimonadales bacterium]|nr:PilX N-terminal domain-containing pilus assembly protein [Gemmatimonadales bacterium]